MKTNKTAKHSGPKLKTAEGAPAKHIGAEANLRRAIAACMLWEDSFYEDGVSIANRIADLVPKVDPLAVAQLAIEARESFKLRHAPLFLVREMVRHDTHRPFVAATLETVIQRADELAEFLAIYWKDGKTPIAAQVKKGLARAFVKFSAYDLAKYNRDNAIKLRDVLFLCHAKPKDKEQAKTWMQLVNKSLPIPDTWEVALSAGEDKKKTWMRLIKEEKLGALALLRNLRNMNEVDVPESIIAKALETTRVDRVLPYRFVAAARYAPTLEPALENAMLRCLNGVEKMPGHTVLLIDVSGSMNSQISGKSEMKRIDAACGLSILLREICDKITVVTFSERIVSVPARRGFALRDAVVNSQSHGGTYLGAALKLLSGNVNTKGADRIIVITDEQSADTVENPKWPMAYIINVATEENGVGYGGWTHIDGWSESTIRYVQTSEMIGSKHAMRKKSAPQVV